MKINVDRMAVLAGFGKKSRQSSETTLNESMDYDAVDEMIEEDDGLYEEDIDDPMEEMIEVDEVELVRELRRAKKIMLESKKHARQQSLQESQLKSIIEEEVQNIFGEMNLNSDWIYGSKKPRRSKKGYTHQGSFLKGLGFK